MNDQTKLWESLIQEAQIVQGQKLSQLLESYLTSLLVKYITNTKLHDEPVAISYLKCQNYKGQVKRNAMQSVGDRCLVLTGLYPETICFKTIDINYLTTIGQSAYNHLHQIIQDDFTFKQLAYQFILMQNTLNTIRNISIYYNDDLFGLFDNPSA